MATIGGRKVLLSVSLYNVCTCVSEKEIRVKQSEELMGWKEKQQSVSLILCILLLLELKV